MSQHHRTLLLATAALFLAVGAAGCSKPVVAPLASPSASGAATNVSDIDVTEHVKTALLRAEALKGSDITVVTTKGDVRLTGSLSNQAQIDEAIRIARAADGAHTVHDELTLNR
jgi:osmotically-inducible protein OsmY